MSFLGDLLKSAIKDLIDDEDFTKWVDKRIQAAIASGESTLMAEVETMETELISHIEGNADKVIADAATRANKIIDDLTGAFKGGLAPLSTTMGAIQNILSNLPHFPGFGVKGQ